MKNNIFSVVLLLISLLPNLNAMETSNSNSCFHVLTIVNPNAIPLGLVYQCRETKEAIVKPSSTTSIIISLEQGQSIIRVIPINKNSFNCPEWFTITPNIKKTCSCSLLHKKSQ